MMMLVETLIGSTTHTAFGACALTSLTIGIDTSVGNVMSNLPEINPRIAVERFGDDGELDAVEVRQALLEVVGIARPA